MIPRVVLLTTTLDPGGAEGQVFRLALELHRRGWEPAVISLLPQQRGAGLPARPPAGNADALKEAGVPVFSLGMRPGRPDPRGLIRLALLLSRLRPQVLHSHMFHANLLARLVRLFCPVPLVISTLHSVSESPRGAGWGGPPGPRPAPWPAFGRRPTGASAADRDVRPTYPGVLLRDWMYRLTDPLADAVVAVSRAVAERHASTAVRRSKLLVIPNGVDTALFRPDPERRARTRGQLGLTSEFVWLAAGRLMWKKDWPTLLRAFAAQRAAVLLIAGEGPLEAELKALASALEIDARFLGCVDDMPALMNAADALALSSLVEGSPMVLLEACASGIPAVAADAGGVSEILDGGEAGLVVPVSDPEAMADAMSRVQSLPPDARGRMSRAARARAEQRYDIGTTVLCWEATYRNLLEKSRWT